ncbi:MAG: type 4a pilus biogenesis protein PilO [Desulfobacterales bacterium]|jgi:type IV pilus assembly protein PilO
MNPSTAPSSGLDAFFAKIESLSKTQRILIFAGVFILIIVVFIYLFYKPKWAEIEKLDKQLTDLEKKLVIAKKNAANLEKFQKQMADAEAQFQTAKKALPERQEIPALLTSISRSGQDAGLEFFLFSPGIERPKEFYAEIPVAMKVKGGYHELALFFDTVARLSRIVNINNISMERDGETLDLDTECTAVTYQFIEPEPQKDTKKPIKRKK